MDTTKNIDDGPIYRDLVKLIQQLISDYRHQYLWFYRENFLPENDAQALKALKQIQRHGDRAGYIRARKLEKWLLQQSKEMYASVSPQTG
ncbi:MAG: hypothetical protein GKR87_10905 [Kiritimatiellae bacterium]|nr:hypothetical protein [Kiritimatiellia bacterium]